MIYPRIIGVFSLAFLALAGNAQEPPHVYKERITPHWFADNQKFWYKNNLPGSKEEYVVIDAVHGTREIVQKPPDGNAPQEGLPAEAAVRPSERNGPETEIIFENRRDQGVELIWIDSTGSEHGYGTVPARGRRVMHTFTGHVWLVTSIEKKNLAVFEATEAPGLAIIDDSLPESATQRMPSRRERRTAENDGRDHSPDGRWTVVLKEHNLFLKPEDGAEIQLSHDGEEDNDYGNWSWSPDSKTLAAFRVQPGDRKEVYLIESSPEGGGRAKLQRRPYALPGDKFRRYELSLFDIASQKQTKPQVDPYEHEWSPPRVHWRKDCNRLRYPQEDRGHQRFRIIEVNCADGSTRNLVDESSKTFIWTAHTEELRLNIVNWLTNSDEIIYASENSGWRHLYLVDPVEGTPQPITAGDWVVRGIDRIDEDARQIWFSASGVFPEQDPYLLHYARANFDGSGLVFLTAGNGNHAIQFSPDRRFIIDTYSRVDAAPVHELRRVSDGTLICELEKADTTELEASGWQPPEVFVAKGRDGQTDIYGIICRPANINPAERYPILEDIYAGPQSSYVPKSFSSRQRYESWTKLGFVVVKIDGMGTANRSKAFHDVCWQNLKDAGLEDRILWMKAAAAKYPYLDISRVGVYGTSAGGQNAAGAVLFHPEFYKAAIANCGCHDNRMDKASWNEQWMGYPVGPQYAASSNIENASKLGGALFLIVGELDHNVPPESTLRFADALIKAGKDFDLLVVPGADHGTRGAASSYVDRRMQDFFLRHLQGKSGPNHNAASGE